MRGRVTLVIEHVEMVRACQLYIDHLVRAGDTKKVVSVRQTKSKRFIIVIDGLEVDPPAAPPGDGSEGK